MSRQYFTKLNGTRHSFWVHTSENFMPALENHLAAVYGLAPVELHTGRRWFDFMSMNYGFYHQDNATFYKVTRQSTKIIIESATKEQARKG